MCGDCLANTRSLINAHFLQGREPEAQEEQGEAVGRGWERRECQETQGGVSGTRSRWGPRREARTGWGGASEGGEPSPQGPAHPPAAPTGTRTRAHCPGPGTAWWEEGGLPGPCLPCRGPGLGGVGGSGPTHSLSPSLPLSLHPSSHSLRLCVSCPAVLLSLPSRGLWTLSVYASESLGLSPISLSVSRPVSCCLWEGGQPPPNSSPCLVPIPPHPPDIRVGTLSSEAEE